MVDILEKRKYKRFVYSWPVVLVLLILLFFIGRASWNIYQKHQETQEKLAAVQTEHQRLKQRYKEIQEEVADLKTKEGVEQAMRERFGVVKENEEVVYIVDRDEDTPEQQTQKEESWWDRLRAFLGL